MGQYRLSLAVTAPTCWQKNGVIGGEFMAGEYFLQTQKTPGFHRGFLLDLMPGSSLLSHGETPHYHRRYGVSLLSSAWGQVGPPR